MRAFSLHFAISLLLALFRAKFSLGFVVAPPPQTRHSRGSYDMPGVPIPQPTTTGWWISPDMKRFGGGGMTATRLYSTKSSGSNSAFRSKRKKTKMKKPKVGSDAKRKAGLPLNSQELADHVSSEYIHGPGGVLRDAKRKRNRFSRQYQDQILAMEMSSQDGPQDGPSQTEMLRNLDRYPALVLNADFQPLSYLPLSLWHWQEAVKAIFSGKVTVVDTYPDVFIRAANLEIPLPSVIALTEYVRPQFMHKPAFTKRNVFLRDEYRCQYCNDLFHTRDLSLDHVVPRCRGGHLSWENAVTSCTACNGKKGSMGLKEVYSKFGMKLRTEPRVPTQFELAATASRMLPRKVHPTWEPFLPYQEPHPVVRQKRSR